MTYRANVPNLTGYMVVVVVLTLAVLWPVRAAALSCLPWGMEDSFQRAARSPQPYVIVLGMLEFRKQDLPKVDWNNQQDVPPETRIKGRIRGRSLNHAGFKAPFQSDVDIVLRCAGPWCPRVAPRAEYLAFLKKTAGGYSLEFDACSAMGYAQPQRQVLDKVKACFAGQPCAPRAH